jgi:hypothetical protein
MSIEHDRDAMNNPDMWRLHLAQLVETVAILKTMRGHYDHDNMTQIHLSGAIDELESVIEYLQIDLDNSA